MKNGKWKRQSLSQNRCGALFRFRKVSPVRPATKNDLSTLRRYIPEDEMIFWYPVMLPHPASQARHPSPGCQERGKFD